MPNAEFFVRRLEENLLAMDRPAARKTLEQALSELGTGGLLDLVVPPVLESIGEKWEKGEAALSQVYMSATICEQALSSCLPAERLGPPQSAVLAIATFQDYHALGKQIVLSVMRSAGFAVKDYGQGLQTAPLVEKVLADKIDILLVSTLMLPSALRIRELRDALDARGSNAKLLVGGAPFRLDEGLWLRVGAHAMGRTSSDALAATRRLWEEAK